MRSPEVLKRHDLVWFDATGHDAGISAADPADVDIVCQWIARERPLIAARRPADTPVDRCALGLPLPPHKGKRRIALLARTAAVRKVRSPPTLERVMTTAPTRYRGPLRMLESRSRDAGIRFRVFGSLAWQFLTGETYVSPDTDLDLLWKPASLTELRRGLDILSDWERTSPIRADGEIVFPDGTGVAWRELAAEPRTVLVKGTGGVGMRALTDLCLLFELEMECRTRSIQSAGSHDAP